MLRRAVDHGVATMRSHLALTTLAWTISAAIAAVAALPIWMWLSATATRPDADVLLERLDPAAIVDLTIANGPAAVMGTIIGTVFSLLVAAIAGVLLNAGLVAVVVTPDGRPMLARFVAGVSAYFLRFLRLAIIAGITGLVLFLVVLLAAALLGRVFVYGATVTPAAIWLTVIAVAFAVTAAIVFTAMDYARIHLALTDRRHAVNAWFGSLRFVLRHPLRAMTLAATFASIASLALIAYSAFAAPATSMLGIVVLFVARQVVIFTRVSARIGLLAAEHELWRTLMPAPPPPPAPVSLPAPAPRSPMDVIDAPI
ncbi:MAG TPA: hypothetical protein VFO19_03750 [Vicinamibacterales bacterium]|nr:hypothetical protein [Vicinamibacterales bacterium]